jgi:RNA polymerase sigma-70 factor (ECF subfamily)
VRVADAESEISDHERVDPETAGGGTLRESGGFDGFFLARHDAMVRALSLTLGDDELGRDAASEGFARALQRWNRVSRYDNPAGWVYRVGLNWALSRRRRSRREVLVGDTGSDDRRAISPVLAPAVADPSITTALKTLSIDHRAVVVGRYYLDWSERQLAEALDVAPGTVKSRLSRALARLQEILAVGPSGSGDQAEDQAEEEDIG